MRDVQARLASVEELCAVFGQRMMSDLLAGQAEEKGHEPRVVVFNSLPGRRRDRFSGLVRIKGRLPLTEYRVLDEAAHCVGRARVVAHRNIDLETCYSTAPDLLALYRKAPDPRRELSSRAIDRADGTRERRDDAVWSLAFIDGSADFRGEIGFIPLTLREDAAKTAVGTSRNVIENDYLRVELNSDGSLSLLDKSTSKIWERLLHFEDAADAGDTYDFNPVAGDEPLRSIRAALVETLDAKNRLQPTLSFKLCWQIPAKLSRGGARERVIHPWQGPGVVDGSRSEEETTLEMRIDCTVPVGSDRVDVIIEMENTAMQHRLRLVMSLQQPIKIIGGSHFTAIERSGNREPSCSRPSHS